MKCPNCKDEMEFIGDDDQDRAVYECHNCSEEELRGVDDA